MSASLTILGCGSSAGVPRVAQGWGACDPENPRNRRRRCSILVRRQGAGGVTSVLVDTSPDMREQLLDTAVSRLDAVLLSHPHADHIHGIDDVRPIVAQMGALMDIHMDAPTAAAVKSAFAYIFETAPGSTYPPLAREIPIVPGAPICVDGPGGRIEAMPFRLDHGDIDALGFRFGATAYTPDVVRIPRESEPYLHDLDCWIIDALRPSPHPTHFSLDQALAQIARFAPRQAILTNLSTELDYEALRRSLPANIQPAFDGMQIDI